ncbi:hypothetical protein F0U44_09590 [Nocardioides humilatus]|uniref:Uncharacterized protein n=1 Tax=Nocardioides humilatus TaxID=2607660 RepID=A0A5B1LDK6_9ACTN|nr:hypothetical protein [Nocardioides humilatus]KAA1418735.1 hypothetical protein F0U44_09590 [Nocardioides humilatus]
MSRRLIAAAVAVASLLALVDSAEATWTPTPPNLSAAGANAVDVVTAVGPNGHVAVAWRRLDEAGDWRIQLRERSDTGTLSAVQTVSSAGNSAYAPDVAVDATGRVVVVWAQRDDTTGSYTVLAKTRSVAGTLSGIKNLSTGVGTSSALRSPDPQLELDPTGAAVVAWQTVFASVSYRAVVRGISAAGVVSPTAQTLSSDGLNVRPVALAVDVNGTATVAWSREVGADTRIEARTRAANGTLGPLKVLTPTGQDNTAPVVAVTPSGDAVLAWIRYDTADNMLYARRLSAAGTLGPVKKISGTDKDVYDDVTIGWGEVGISDAGDAVLVWHQAKPCCAREVAVRGLSAANALSTITLAGIYTYSYQPQVAVAPDGSALVGFTQRDETFWDRIVVRTRATDGTLGAVQTLSAFGRDATYSDLAMNDAGVAASAWVREDSADPSCCDRAQYAVGP